MIHSSSSPPCPEHDQLLALAEGRLTDLEADTLVHHVTECNSCDARLEQIEELSDPLVQSLSVLPATEDDEATFVELQARLLASPEQFTGTIGLTGGHTAEMSDELVPLPLQGVLPFQLGNYDLLEQIGTGAHGAVFRARHRRLEREVAIKLLLRARGPSVDEFLHEMRVIGKLDHPNIVRATDAGEHEGIYFLVMDFVPGLDVSSLLRRAGPLSVPDACEIAKQTAMGLAFAHEHNLVHRDVKTSNLLFSSNGTIKLLDLGLAMIPSVSGNNTDTDNGPTNMYSGPRGTADYMAPEQWKASDEVTPQSDLYSLGCTLFKLLTGQPPFKSLPDGVNSKQLAHETAPIPSLSDFRDDVPEALERLVHKLLAKSPADRPDSAQAVCDQLTHQAIGADFRQIVRHHCPELELPSPVAEPFSHRTRRLLRRVSRRTWLAGSLSLTAGAVVFLATRPNVEPAAVDISNWRDLRPAQPPIVRLPESDPGARLIDANTMDVELESDSLAMLHLGTPMKKPFRWRTKLMHDARKSAPARDTTSIQKFGVFFRLRRNRDDQFGFQTIEVRRNGTSDRLLWCEYDQPDAMREPLVLAETSLPVRLPCTIELVIGRTGFPIVSINDQVIPQGKWILSKQASDLAASNVDQLSKIYAGRIGVVQHGGITSIQSSQLLYLE